MSVFLVIVGGKTVSAQDFNIIKNPKPTCVEKKYIRLTKVREIKDEVAKDVYLFLPYATTMDSQKNLYVYDKMQGKILKFDQSYKYIKSIGRQGMGPGEFHSPGRHHPVYINIGQDGNLYAHEVFGRQIIKWNTDGKFLDVYKYKKPFNAHLPCVSKNGSPIYQHYENGYLNILDTSGKIYFKILQKEQKNYLFKGIELPSHPALKNLSRRLPFFYNGYELICRTSGDSKLIVYFSCSSKFYILTPEGQLIKEFFAYPQDAIGYRKKRVENLAGPDYIPLFNELRTDSDNADLIYLYFGSHEERKEFLLYKMTTNGKLLAVLSIPFAKSGVYSTFLSVRNNTFIFLEDEKLIIYKEKTLCQKQKQ